MDRSLSAGLLEKAFRRQCLCSKLCGVGKRYARPQKPLVQAKGIELHCRGLRLSDLSGSVVTILAFHPTAPSRKVPSPPKLFRNEGRAHSQIVKLPEVKTLTTEPSRAQRFSRTITSRRVLIRDLIALPIGMDRSLSAGLLEKAFRRQCLCFKLCGVGKRYVRQQKPLVQAKGIELHCRGLQLGDLSGSVVKILAFRPTAPSREIFYYLYLGATNFGLIHRPLSLNN